MSHLRICWCGRTYRHEATKIDAGFDYRVVGVTPPAMPPTGIGDWWATVRNNAAGHCPDEQDHGPSPQSAGVTLINVMRDRTRDELAEALDRKSLSLFDGI